MTELAKCSQCGATLPTNSPGGHCLRCLLLLGMPNSAGTAEAHDKIHFELASAAAISERDGDSIGRYKLLEQIGEGGCGVVYRAEQTEPVRRAVALKLIKPGMDTKQVLARFEAER